jgi:hypothetical protein
MYETLAANAQLGNDCSMPELGRLKAASEHIAVATNRVENFLQRFAGTNPPSGGSVSATQPQSCYRDDLNSVFTQLDRLQHAVSMLDAIG